MDFAFDDDQVELQTAVADVLVKECTPAYLRSVVEDGHDPADLWSTLVSLDWPALAIPEADGGVGASFLELAIVVEQLGYVADPTPFLTTTTQFAPLVAACGSAEQRERFWCRHRQRHDRDARPRRAGRHLGPRRRSGRGPAHRHGLGAARHGHVRARRRPRRRDRGHRPLRRRAAGVRGPGRRRHHQPAALVRQGAPHRRGVLRRRHRRAPTAGSAAATPRRVRLRRWTRP